ncbi:hypothetical protein GCM10009786_24190 [Leucobacter alluvii]|uniref:Energy-coupling factor transport system substrate-specific component n=1 Tax=Leucobacter alluvii TaxID=340321 RepID=A0ABN3B862_9MICO
MTNPDSFPRREAENGEAENGEAESFDRIARDLRELREAAGPVSFAELVRRIADLRIGRGVSAAAAIPARSTVYNAFQSGRSRMDPALLRDIVLALGQSEEEAVQWVQRTRHARRIERASVAEPSGSAPRPGSDAQSARRLPALPVLLLLLGLVVCNHASHWFLAAPLDLPVYLDMVGTAVASIALGPWYGVAVAIATGLTGPMFEPGIMAFTLVNVTGALVWGYGVRRFRFGHDILGFFVLSLLAATACSLVATPILVAIRGGAYGAIGRISESLQEAGMPFIAATFTPNLSTSILDKLLTGFIALAIFAVIRSRMRLSAKHMPLIEQLGALRETPGRKARVSVFAQI